MENGQGYEARSKFPFPPQPAFSRPEHIVDPVPQRKAARDVEFFFVPPLGTSKKMGPFCAVSMAKTRYPRPFSREYLGPAPQNPRTFALPAEFVSTEKAFGGFLIPTMGLIFPFRVCSVPKQSAANLDAPQNRINRLPPPLPNDPLCAHF